MISINFTDMLQVNNFKFYFHFLLFTCQVTLSVEEITKDKKVIAFKMRRRKNSKRTKGFRRDITILRVKDITLKDSSLTDELLR